jgi:hypothetical protein
MTTTRIADVANAGKYEEIARLRTGKCSFFRHLLNTYRDVIGEMQSRLN